MKSPALAGLRQSGCRDLNSGASSPPDPPALVAGHLSAKRKLALRNRTLFALASMPRVPEGASACLGASAGILAAGPVEASYTHFVIRVASCFGSRRGHPPLEPEPAVLSPRPSALGTSWPGAPTIRRGSSSSLVLWVSAQGRRLQLTPQIGRFPGRAGMRPTEPWASVQFATNMHRPS